METLEQSTVIEEPLAAKAASPVGYYAIVAIALVAGIVLRWIDLGKASLWFDEGYTAWAVSLSWKQIVHVIRVDTAPPLFYLLLHGWTHLFGRSESGLRAMSALMATIGLLFFAGISNKILKSYWARATAILLFSISFMQIAYAHEARFYAMMTMAGAIDFYLVLLVCERSSWMRLAALIGAWTFSLYTNNMMAIYLACLGLCWLLLPGARSTAGRFKDLLIVSIICAACFAPWVPTMLAQSHRIQGAFWVEKPDKWILANTIGSLAGIHERSASVQMIVTIDVELLGLAVLASGSKPALRKVLGLLAFGLLPILLIFVYSQFKQPIFIDRAFLPSGIMFPLLVGLGIDVIRSKPGRFLAQASALLLIWLCVRSLPDHLLGEHPEAWRDATAFAQSSSAQHRLVICVSSDGEPLYRYYGCYSDYALRPDVTAAPASFFAMDPPRTMQQIKGDRDLDSVRAQLKSGNFDEVVLMSSHNWWGDSQDRTLRLLTSELPQIDRRVFTAITVYRFKSHSR